MTDHADTIRRACETRPGRDEWLIFVNGHSDGELREYAAVKIEDADALLAELRQAQEDKDKLLSCVTDLLIAIKELDPEVEQRLRERWFDIVKEIEHEGIA